MKVYFDNASTTFPKPKVVVDNIYNYLINVGGNANRSASSNSLETSRQLCNARETVADFFNFHNSSNVIFTNNITTSLNMLIKGFLKEGFHVISSSMEHNSILRPLMDLKETLNIDLTLINASSTGYISASQIKKAIKPNTKLIILSHASNVTGSIQPLEEIGKICSDKNIFFIIDSAQSAGVINVDMKKLNADAIAFTGHKSLLGPQGSGGFIINDKLNDLCNPIITGGTGSLSYSLTQPDFLPDKFESGTLNMPGIIGLASGINYIKSIGRKNIESKIKLLRSTLYSGLKNIKDVTVYGGNDPLKTTTCISFNINNVDPSELSYFLDKNNISSRSGLHCAPLAHKSIGTFPEGTVRFSLSYFNTLDEIDYVLSVLNKFNKSLL